MPVRKDRRRKPDWQDTTPKDAEQRDLYQIARDYEFRFREEYHNLYDAIFSDQEILNRFRSLIQNGQLNEAIETLPFLVSNRPELMPLWIKFLEGLERTYLDIIIEGGNDALREAGVDKEFKEKIEEGDDLRALLIIGPLLFNWVRNKVINHARLLSEDQKKVIQDIVLSAYADNQNINLTMEEIKLTSGLNLIQLKTYKKIKQTMKDAGASPDKIQDALLRKTNQMRAFRADMIARTETVEAQARGKNEAWDLALLQGLMPSDSKRQWVAAIESDRTCKICRELDGQSRSFNEAFQSHLIGIIPHPPAHPQCRCVLVLV